MNLCNQITNLRIVNCHNFELLCLTVLPHLKEHPTLSSVRAGISNVFSFFLHKLAYFTVRRIAVGGQGIKLLQTRISCSSLATLRFYYAIIEVGMFLISIRKGSWQILLWIIYAEAEIDNNCNVHEVGKVDLVEKLSSHPLLSRKYNFNSSLFPIFTNLVTFTLHFHCYDQNRDIFIFIKVTTTD